MLTHFQNQVRGYNIVLAALKAFERDLCRKCIGLSASRTKMQKGLKKLRLELERSMVPESDQRLLLAQIEQLLALTAALDVAAEVECQKTTGACKMGSGCFCLDGALGLMAEINGHTPGPSSYGEAAK
jgi:hypothetical protein